MTANRKPRWTSIQRNAIRFVLETLHRNPFSAIEVGALAEAYAESLPAGHDRLGINSRLEPHARQDVRNIVSHALSASNPIRLGIFEYDEITHTLRLSEKGRALAAKHFDQT